MLRIVDRRTGRTVPVGERADRRVRLAVVLPDADPDRAVRALVVADLARRVLEGVHGRQVRGTVFGPVTPIEARLAALWVPVPEDVRAVPSGAADLVVAGTDEDVAVAGPTLAVAAASGAGGADPTALRLVLLSTPPAEPLHLDAGRLADAAERVRAWRGAVARAARSPSAPVPAGALAAATAACDDGLDIAALLAELDRMRADPSMPAGAVLEAYLFFDRVLALDLPRDIGTGG